MFSDTMDRLGETTRGRDAFITKAYQHLLLAIGAFLALETYLFTSGLAYRIAAALTGVSWLLVLGAFFLSVTSSIRFKLRSSKPNSSTIATALQAIPWPQ